MATSRALKAVDLRRLWDRRPELEPATQPSIIGRDAVRAAWMRAKLRAV